MKRYPALLLLLLLALTLAACQSGPSLKVSPTTLTVFPGDPATTFTATLTGGSGTVVWSLSPATGGGSITPTSGTTISYTPPDSVGSVSSVTLTATLQGTSVSAGATITINNNVISDKSLKTGFTLVDPANILAKVSKLPLSVWSYKTDPASVRHIGPMAQDFHTAFGLNGADDQHIAIVDQGGVALAAIQGLYQENQQLLRENRALKARLDDLERRLEALEGR
ncbi:MAG: hypothetical protein C4331_07610 [Meiothermus sp.]